MRNRFISITSLILADIGAVFISFVLAYLVRAYVLPGITPKYGEIGLFPFSLFLDKYYMVATWIIIFSYEKLYTKRYSFWQEVRVLIQSSTTSSILIILAVFITRSGQLYSRTIIILAWVFSLFLFPAIRFLVKIVLLKFHFWTKKLIIIGVHHTSLKIIQNICQNRIMGYEVMGIIDDDPDKIGKTYGGIQVVGPLSDIRSITEKYGSKDIMISTPHLPRKKLREILTLCEDVSDSMWFIPRSGDFITEGAEIEVMGDVLTLHIKRNLKKPGNILLKSAVEKSLTLVGLVLLLPFLGVIAVAIKLDSKGAVFYIQKRVGKDNKPFNLYKFRSMEINSDRKLAEYLAGNKKAQREWEKYKKLRGHDPRVTRVGRFIRKYSLDELPQLFNVLEGKMSLVGPRPYLAEELAGNDELKMRILRAKPGITGLWQISGRNELPFTDRLSIDEYYIRNWSLWLDVIILMKSFRIFLSRKGAY